MTSSSEPRRQGSRTRSRWWSGNAERGDSARLEAFSDGVLATAITLLILDVRVEPAPGESLAAGLRHALPAIGAYAASFLQIGIMWANHHALFRVIDRVDQLLLLANLIGLAGYAVATLLALIRPWLTLAATALLALLFILGPSPRPANS